MNRNYLILALGLIAYGIKRYNGYDFESYFTLAEVVHSGERIYGDRLLSLYPPVGAYLFEIFHFLPKATTHKAWYLISVLLFVRMSHIGFSFFSVTKERDWKTTLFYWLSWISILQGLGAQLEGGNINLLLMCLMIEGLNILLKRASTTKNVTLGLLFIWLPIFFKPYLGIISSGLTLFFIRRSGWRALFAPVIVAILMTVFPALIKGFETVRSDYIAWLSGDISYIDCAFTLKCNAVNYGFPSYLYQVQHWSLARVAVFVLAVSVVALIYALFEKNLLRLSGALSLITFCISPASFPYTLMLLWIPVLSASYWVIFGERKVNRKITFCAFIFLGAMIFLNPTYVGRSFFNEVIVYYRVTTFFILFGFGALSAGIKMAERERFELSIGY